MRHSARIGRWTSARFATAARGLPRAGMRLRQWFALFGTHGWVPGHSVVKPSPKPEHNVSTCNDGETLFEAGRNNDVSCPTLNK